MLVRAAKKLCCKIKFALQNKCSAILQANFAMQTNEITIEQVPAFGNEFFINIPQNGDLIHRCFFEVTIPKLNIDDSSIKNTDYLKPKVNKEKIVSLIIGGPNKYYDYDEKIIKLLTLLVSFGMIFVEQWKVMPVPMMMGPMGPMGPMGGMGTDECSR